MFEITYIGHATTLIKTEGSAILTDPNFSKGFYFIKRKLPMNYDLTKLPKIDAVVLSHIHYDHLDIPSFKYMPTTVPIFCPPGGAKYVKKHLPNPVIELPHWESHTLANGTQIISVPAMHRSFRKCSLCRTESCGYVIKSANETVFFAGDTTYDSHFAEIKERFADIDVALLPIGGYKPRFLFKKYHMNPLEAVEAFVELGAKKFIPIHWGTFRLSFEKPDEPLKELNRVAAERSIADKVHVLSSGEYMNI